MISLEEALRPVLARAVAAGERWRTGVAYNPLSRAMARDPYPVYAALRARGALHRSRLMNAWLVADADAILRDHRNFANDPRLGTLTRRQQAMLPPPDEYTLLLLDPPDHTRLRALVNKALTSRAVGALETRIRAIAAELLDAVDDPGEVRLGPLPPLSGEQRPKPSCRHGTDALPIGVSPFPTLSSDRSGGARRGRRETAWRANGERRSGRPRPACLSVRTPGPHEGMRPCVAEVGRKAGMPLRRLRESHRPAPYTLDFLIQSRRRRYWRGSGIQHPH